MLVLMRLMRLVHLQQQLQDLQQDELQRKEQQVAEQQQQLQQQQADMHLREQQLAEQQHQLQQQQADMQQREQQVAQQQQQVQQQQADLQLREQHVAQQHHQLQQQQADLQQREQHVAEQQHHLQLQQQLNRLQQQLEAQSAGELQRQVQQQLAVQQHLLQQQHADLLLKQQHVEKQLQEAADQQGVSTNHPLPDHPPCSPHVPESLRSPLLKRPRQDTTLAPLPSVVQCDESARLIKRSRLRDHSQFGPIKDGKRQCPGSVSVVESPAFVRGGLIPIVCVAISLLDPALFSVQPHLAAAANERVFSSFKHIWSDKRSSLLLGRMWLMAFIYFNKRVLERRPKPQLEAEWQQFAQWMQHMPAEA
ncbi:hypothetical protein QJQ45_002772 [Haematococcus lacustris]|nr:hypothetical protein QJQ45_002772 [Haematococcus lacustris]